MSWLAPAFALTLAAAPLLARLCEAHCAGAVHCHENAPQKQNGCPEKSHRAETSSLRAAVKISVAAVDSGALSAASPVLESQVATAAAHPAFSSVSFRRPDPAGRLPLRL